MENKIRLLPEIVANQIAAGEVVENPSSVVKEMMENAVDAGATSVTVNFRNAGMDLIQIVDNGCGMSPVDARMAFDRHATSKISSLDDVYRLHTFGFRGEALASIAAVSQVELRTRRPDDEIGTVTVVNGGEFVSQTPTMCPAGSQFLVRNLFYSVPVRRKFNSERTRMVSDIKREFRRVALCNPQVRFELMSNDMSIITLPAGSLLERIIDVAGRHIKTNLLEVSVDTSIVKVTGFTGRPSAAKQKNAEQYLFVNGRYFRSQQVYRSIMKAYEKLIPDNCSPSFFLYLTVEPDRIDVNVHAKKTEVRFADADDVCQIVNAAVRSTLAKSGAVSMMDFDNSVRIEIPAMNSRRGAAVYKEPKSSSNDDYNPFREDYAAAAPAAEDVDFSGFDAPYDGTADMPSAGAVRGARALSPALSDEASEGRRLRDISWAEMPLDSGFAVEPAADADVTAAAGASAAVVDTAARSAGTVDDAPFSGGYREIASSALAGSPDAADAEASSRLEYIASSAVQQTMLPEEGKPAFSDFLPLGDGYAVALCGNRSVAIDLRRAKERVIYDGYMAVVGCGSSPSQRLLFPDRMVLSEAEYLLLEENMVEFAALGFDIEPCGDCAVEVRGIPSCITGEQADRLLFELLHEVETSGDAGERMREEMVRVLASKGARAAVRGLSREETGNLLRQLCECDDFSFSPSGKAIMADLTVDDLKAKLN